MRKSSIIPAVLIACFATIVGKSQNNFCNEIEKQLHQLNKRFPFGVASGDPRYNSVVIWTSIYSDKNNSEIEVKYEISRDSLFTEVDSKGTSIAIKSNAFCVKVEPRNLSPGTKYFYRFFAEGEYSPIGRTYTASDMKERLRFAVVSCSNYEWGYFNAYASLAKENDLQAIIHLGDYIYEYQPGKYGNNKIPRKHLPEKELLSLEDYRSRYAQYRLDNSLQEIHRLYPFITIWDDHEFANDAYMEGAQNHQQIEGSWEIRKNIAQKAYFEWLPIEESKSFSIRRKFQFGEMADLFMLDGRMEGRDKQVSAADDPARLDSSRTMLGKNQTEWLINEIDNSKAHWKLVGNQVIFSPFDYPTKLTKYSKSMDMWEGYPIERNYILNHWYKNNEKNVIILTGDVHASFSLDLRNDMHKEETSVGVEWVTTSVTSSNLNEYSPNWKVRLVEKWFREKKMNPHMDLIDFRNHGYLIIELDKMEASATWKYERDITKPRPRIKKELSRKLRWRN